MIIIQFLGAIIYFYMIIGIGTIVSDKILKENSIRHSVLSLIFGSITIGITMFSLIHLNLIYTSIVYPLIILLLVISSFKYQSIFKDINIIFKFLRKVIFTKKSYAETLLICFLLIILWLILLAGTPPRAGDVMRYHLAQLKDIVWNHGYVYRPYYHYNFPRYFGYAFLPLFMCLKGVAIQFSVLFCFFITIFTTIRIAYLLGIKYLRFIMLFMVFVPLAFQEAHIAFNDWQTCLYFMLGLLLFLELDFKKKPYFLILPFLSLGFSLGIKYQAILYIPWFMIILWNSLKETQVDIKTKIKITFFSLLCMSFIASPFYIKNFIQFGNPVWPLMQKLFYHNPNNYLFQVTQRYTGSLKGTHCLATYIQAIKDLFKYPLLPFSYFILGFLGLFYEKKTKIYLKIGVFSFFVVLIMTRPRIYWRYGIFILPILIILATSLIQHTKFKLMKYLFIIISLVTIIYGVFIACWYSYGLLKPYYIDRNIDEYHKATWYYQEYKWINNNLPKDANILVIVLSGHTYYLDRKYVRGDIYSGLIEWPKIHNTLDLIKTMKFYNIEYVLFDENQLKAFKNINGMFNELIKKNKAKLIFERKVNLYTSRIKNNFMSNKVKLLKFAL